ncbi:MAG: NAD(P)-dependent oxidoreductase [Desulfobacteraceae bacterium]|nr:MAG: NAD(P)-dependent oxidoreductase [Desulfobacteraceae bacterium]
MKILVTGGSGFIGTNLVHLLLTEQYDVVNLDKKAPLNSDHRHLWVQSDIQDFKQIARVFSEFRPQWVIHLAARTDVDENTTVEEGYAENTTGVKNILRLVKQNKTVTDLIVISTQYVCKPGHIPRHDEDYSPWTVYGRSKVETERLTRRANLNCRWTIIRPTNIWGPWHVRYGKELLYSIKKGYYLHPGKTPCMKSYGYVENVTFQILCLLKNGDSSTCGKTLYAGDEPINLLEWVNELSLALTGRNVRIAPLLIVRLFAFCGDIITKLTGHPFLLTTSRYNSMIQDYVVPMKKMLDLVGPSPIIMKEGVRRTVNWYEKTGLFTN